MESELIIPEGEKSSLYPYWGIANEDTDYQIVVEFTARNTGIVLQRGNTSPYQFGQNCTDWAESNFIPLPKTAQIVLSQ